MAALSVSFQLIDCTKANCFVVFTRMSKVISKTDTVLNLS